MGLKLEPDYQINIGNMKQCFQICQVWKKNKIGFIGQVYVEKNFGKYISTRPAIGYTQKGFVDDLVVYNDLSSIEFEFNPSFSKNFDSGF